jgi:hypothetical protein
MSGWAWAWIAWAVMFGVVEGLALWACKPGHTLSLYLQHIFGVEHPTSRAAKWRRGALAVGLLVLSAHLLGAF